MKDAGLLTENVFYIEDLCLTTIGNMRYSNWSNQSKKGLMSSFRIFFEIMIPLKKPEMHPFIGNVEL